MALEPVRRAPPSAARRWYRLGLRFECLPDCGRCCSRHSDYGYVYLVGGDTARAARALGLSPEAFLARYAMEEDGHTLLRMKDNECPFLEGTRCGVYDGRPTQCRTFPFWKENLRSRDRWESLRAFCPGIGIGALIPAEAILATARESDPE